MFRLARNISNGLHLPNYVVTRRIDWSLTYPNQSFGSSESVKKYEEERCLVRQVASQIETGNSYNVLYQVSCNISTIGSCRFYSANKNKLNNQNGQNNGRHIVPVLSKWVKLNIASKSISPCCRFMNTMAPIPPAIEKKVNVGGIQINYLRTGIGGRNVLCLPGSLGTIWTDFSAQIAGFDLNKFTLVVWDPPGYGKSRPPERKFSPNFLELDADLAAELLKVLNINKCSLLGWSDGGNTALIMAAKYPKLVDKLVVWGANAYFTDEDIEAYEKIRDVSNWSTGMRNVMSNIYGMEDLQKMMNAWIDSCIHIRKYNDGNLCVDLLPKIEASTMILHGEQDPLVPSFHPKFLKKNIRNSVLHLLQDGKHNIHLKYAELFNKLVQSFLMQE